MFIPAVYDQHRKHTQRVSAHVILKDGEHVANVTIVSPKDGAGRLYAYVHWLGRQMIRGSASGYGYDKLSAAIANAAHKRLDGWDKAGASVHECIFWEHLALNDGNEWHNQLYKMGFVVLSPC